MPRPRSLARTAAVLAVSGAAAASLVTGAGAASAANGVAGPTLNAATSGRCAPATTKNIAGTLKGKDGLGLNATIGFDLLDGAGHHVDARTGCTASGYGAILQLNHYISDLGAPIGSEMTSAQGQDEGAVSANFSLNDIPANVKTVFLETYTRKYTGSPCGLPCAGATSNYKYGNVNRMFLPVAKAGNLNLIADTTKQFGGDTGTIQVYVPTTGKVSVHAWSMAIKGNVTDEGWGTGIQSSSNKHIWTVPALSPGQDYTMIVGGYAQKYHIKVKKNSTTKVSV